MTVRCCMQFAVQWVSSWDLVKIKERIVTILRVKEFAQYYDFPFRLSSLQVVMLCGPTQVSCDLQTFEVSYDL